MAISAARKIAYEILRRVESEGAYASDLLHAELGANVKTVDAALATEIVLGVLRWQRQLDFLLDSHMKKPVSRLDVPVAVALRMGIYQLRFLDRIPARAIVNESVEIVKHARKTSAATLVNAVLRRAGAEAKQPAEKFLFSDTSAPERLAILHSHPTWMVERWLARLGEAGTTALLTVNNRAPRLSCAIHDDSRRDDVFSGLKHAGLRIEPGQLLRSAFAVSGGSPARTAVFRTGKISIQDEASQLVPLLLDVQPGDRVLDLCAAPGGKTPPLVRGAGKSGVVVAGERHAHRLRAMREQLKRLNLRDVRLVELDAEKALPFCTKFNRILVDAPCSGTGTVGRHPEIRWRLKPTDPARMATLQLAMLRNAAALLRPDGAIVYSVCSLMPEEGPGVVAQFMAKDPRYEIDPHPPVHEQIADLLCEDGTLLTRPDGSGLDGFFAARIVRR